MTDRSTRGAGLVLVDPEEADISALSGVINFRDLGGLPAGGGRQVRRARVFRSAGLCEVTVADADVIRDQLRLTTVVDLRSHVEVNRDGVGLLDTVQRVHLPLIHDDRTAPSRRDGDRSSGLAVRYLAYLETAANSVVEVLRVLADRRAQPALIHCSAGKDRTGIVVAMLLHTLGVSSEHIVADYAASQPNRDEVVDYLARRPSYRDGLLDRLPQWALDADPATMRDLLDAIGRDHGGVAELLSAHGLTEELGKSLREALLEPAAACVPPTPSGCGHR